jgi:molecular chaperone DnaK (HSP70)
LKKKNEKKISLGGQNLSLALTIKTTEKEITDKTKELEQLYDRLELLHETIYENKGELSKMQNEKTEIEKQIETSEDGLNKIKIKSNEAREQMYSEFNSRLVRKGDIIAGRCIEGFEIHGKHYAHIVTNESERFMPWSKEHYAKVIGKDISLRKDMEGKIQDFKVVSIVQTIQTGRPEPVEGPKIGGGGGMRMG